MINFFFCAGGTHRYDPTKSTTVTLYKNIPLSDNYGSGSVKGIWATDSVTVGICSHLY